MHQAVQKRCRGHRLGEEAAPLLEGPVAGDGEAFVLVRRGDEAEEELAVDGVERGEAQLVDDEQIGMQERIKDWPDGVVGPSPIELLDEVHRREVPHAQARLHRGLAQRDQQVAPARARRADQDEVLMRPDTLQRREVVEGRLRHRAFLDLELSERAASGEGRRSESGATVRFVAHDDLGLDQCAQQLLGRPALDLRALQHLGREGAHRAQSARPTAKVQARADVVDILPAGEYAPILTNRLVPARHLEEFDLSSQPTTDGGFKWTLRAASTRIIQVGLNPRNELLKFFFTDSGVNPNQNLRRVPSAVSLAGIQKERVLRLAAAIDGSRYRLFVDGELVADMTDDRFAVPSSAQATLNLGGSLTTGGSTLGKLEVHELRDPTPSTAPRPQRLRHRVPSGRAHSKETAESRTLRGRRLGACGHGAPRTSARERRARARLPTRTAEATGPVSGLALASLAAQRRALARRTVSALELANEHLDRIERLEPYLNAFTLYDPDRVRRSARAADRELARGDDAPLRGVPIALKDIIDERGLPNTAGSALRLRVVPTRDATAVARLRAAGAVFVGRTNLHEFAAGTTNANATFGQARNPHDPGRIPGGSSGGSAAAVAAGLAAGAVGTDTAGSIRIPAALCGVVGLKPTYGRISRAGVVPLSWSLDHVGPLARTVADVGTLLAVMAGIDPRDPSTTAEPLRVGRGRVRGLRFSFADPYFHNDVDPSIATALRAVRRALLGAGLREVRTRIPMVVESGSMQFLIGRAESAAVHLEDFVPARAARIGPDVLARLTLGRDIGAVDYLQAQRARSLLMAETYAALEVSDVLIVPTTAAGAIPIGATHAVVGGRRQSQRELFVRFTSPFNLTGNPALAIPIGFDRAGLPISAQVVGRAYDEATVLRVGAAIEAALALDLVPAIARIAPGPAASSTRRATICS